MYSEIISVAPMLDYTDRHFRYLLRLITRKTFLYTEMVTANQIIHDPSPDLLTIHPIENPIALQLGGSDPRILAYCTELAIDKGYDEVNLNVGCPSDRVQSGGIGACLMLQPEIVAECIAAMSKVSSIPITVKCRLGVDNRDSYENLYHFIKVVSLSGCSKFIIHARKALLKGLSPKQNREIPPLDYDRVYRLKEDFPELVIILNGGVKSFEEVDSHLTKIDGVMVGRAVVNNPCFLSRVDMDYFNETLPPRTQEQIVTEYMNYVESELSKGVKLSNMTRHLLKLFYQMPRARSWRQYLSSNSPNKGAGVEVIKNALDIVVG